MVGPLPGFCEALDSIISTTNKTFRLWWSLNNGVTMAHSKLGRLYMGSCVPSSYD